MKRTAKIPQETATAQQIGNEGNIYEKTQMQNTKDVAKITTVRKNGKN